MSETSVFLLLIFFGIYFIPTLVAIYRYHKNRNSIVVINLFLGWTLVGWVVALAMAVTNNVEKRPVFTPDKRNTRNRELREPKKTPYEMLQEQNEKQLLKQQQEKQLVMQQKKKKPLKQQKETQPLKHFPIRTSTVLQIAGFLILLFGAFFIIEGQRGRGAETSFRSNTVYTGTKLPEVGQAEKSYDQTLIEARRARTDSIDRELRKSDGTLNANRYADLHSGNDGSPTDYMKGFSMGFSSQTESPESPSVDIYPSEDKRVSITGMVIETEVSKDQWDRQTIVLGVITDNGTYICKFPHEEAKRLFGQIAALITQGNPKGFLITLSGLPVNRPDYNKYKMTVLEKCKFTHWRII